MLYSHSFITARNITGGLALVTLCNGFIIGSVELNLTSCLVLMIWTAKGFLQEILLESREKHNRTFTLKFIFPNTVLRSLHDLYFFGPFSHVTCST